MSKHRIKAMGVAAVVAAFSVLGLAASASAYSPEFQKFQYCPYTNTEVKKCVVSVTESGTVTLGSKKVPIVNPVTLQGGFGKADKTTKISKFFGATNGVTLEPVGQPTPGGLLGLVPPEGSPQIIKELVRITLENGFTGVNSTLELARPANEIQISETNLSREEGLAMLLPVKFHLENPFLGSNCYVGSEAAPVYWNLTSGVTSPPGPNEPISGNAGKIEFRHEAEILELTGNSLVENAWAAPKAHGCGGPILELLVDPIINLAAGLESKAGKNTAILNNTIDITTPGAVEEDAELNP